MGIVDFVLEGLGFVFGWFMIDSDGGGSQVEVLYSPGSEKYIKTSGLTIGGPV